MTETRLASLIDNNGYFTGTCLVNKDPMQLDKDIYILPDNAVLLEPPKNINKPCTRYRYNLEHNCWLEEVDKSSFFRFKDRLFSATQLDINVIRLLLDTKLTNYTVLDIDNKPLTITFLELIDLKTSLARKLMLMRGYYNIFSDKEKESFKDLIIN